MIAAAWYEVHDARMIRADRIQSDLQQLARFGASEDGVDRPSFSPAYRHAIDWLATRMLGAGLDVREDAAGNLIGRMGPVDKPAVVSGSHIDSVPNGGIYDGALGVLSAIETARSLVQRNIVLKNAFEVIAFMDEEGAYLGELGCRAMAGDITGKELEGCTGRQGIPLIEAMDEYGLNPDQIAAAARPPSDFAAYVELHIEQGPVLEQQQADIGVVTGIPGIQVCNLEFLGEANHAGTTPLPLRKDAFRAAAETVAAVFRRFEAQFATDEDRVTFGDIRVQPGAQNVVPGTVSLTLEIRSANAGRMESLSHMAEHEAQSAGRAHGVAVKMDTVSFDEAATMSPRLIDLITDETIKAGFRFRHMPSGAGHDAQVMARLTEAGMIFIPSAGGISHNPAEFSSEAQIERGATVLCRTLETLLTAR